MRFVTENFKSDRGVVLAAVQQNGLALEFALFSPRKSRDVLLAAVQNNGLALQFAQEKMKNDEEVAIRALSHVLSSESWHECALPHVGDKLRGNKEVILTAARHNRDRVQEVLRWAEPELQEEVLRELRKDACIWDGEEGEGEALAAATSMTLMALAGSTAGLRGGGCQC